MYRAELAFQNNLPVENNNNIEKIKKDEAALYRGDIKLDAFLAMLSSELEKRSDDENLKAIYEFYLGMNTHYESNHIFMRFNSQMYKNSAGKVPDRSKFSEEYENFESREELEAEEDKALEHYESALSNWRDGKYITKEIIMAMICDIKHRQAERISNNEEREQNLEMRNTEYKEIIRNIDSSGIRGEFQFIWFVRKILKKEGLDHLVSIYHALPLSDHKDKTDIEIVCQDKLINVDVKTLSGDSNTREYNDNYMKEQRKKIAGLRIELLKLDYEKLKDNFRLAAQGDLPTNYKRRLSNFLNGLLLQIKEDLFKKYNISLLDKETVDAGETKEKLNPKMIMKNSNVPTLIDLGYLSKDDSIDIDSIMKAKENLEKALKNKKDLKRIKGYFEQKQ